MIKMPGKSYSDPLPPLTDDQITLRAELRRHIDALAGKIGDKNTLNYINLSAAADYIESALTDAGHTPRRQNFTADAKTCSNIEVQITGSTHPDEIVVIGSHYDSVYGSPGANDNCSAVAANLALARRFKDTRPDRTLRFLFFANEEMPFFQTDQMGSRVYAKSCRDKNENIVAMLSIETIGYYTDSPNSQKYPFPSQGGAIPEFIPGINWSDHDSFWQYNYPAIMVTDTAPYRYPYYHSPDDTIDKICFDHLTRVTSGLQSVIYDLATSN